MRENLHNFASIARKYFSEESTPSDEVMLEVAATLLTDAKRNLIYNVITGLNDFFKNENIREIKYPLFLAYLSESSLEAQVNAVRLLVAMLNGISWKVALLQKEASAITAKFDLFKRTMQVNENPFGISGLIFQSKYMANAWKIETQVTEGEAHLTLYGETNTFVFSNTEPVENVYRDFFYFVVKEIYSFMNVTDADIKESGVGL